MEQRSAVLDDHAERMVLKERRLYPTETKYIDAIIMGTLARANPEPKSTSLQAELQQVERDKSLSSYYFSMSPSSSRSVADPFRESESHRCPSIPMREPRSLDCDRGYSPSVESMDTTLSSVICRAAVRFDSEMEQAS